MNDESLILKHINHQNANAGTPSTSCDRDCRLRHVCRQRYASYDRYIQCTRLFDTTTTTVPSTVNSPDAADCDAASAGKTLNE